MIKELVRSGYILSGRKDKRLSIGLALAVVEGFFVAMPYIVLYSLLNDLLLKNITGKALLLYAVVMIALVVIRILMGIWSMPMIFDGAYEMMGYARLRVADHLRKLPIGWFATERSGNLAYILTADLELIEHIWSHFMGLFISTFAMPFFLSLFLFWVDWQLTKGGGR